MFNKSFQALILSILVHIGLVATMYFAPAAKKDLGPITIEILDSESEKKGPRYLVKETETEQDKLLKELKSQSDLLSKYTKQVKKQQYAKGDSKRSGQRGTSPVPTRPSGKKLDLKPRPQKLFASGAALKTKPRKPDPLQERVESAEASMNRTFAIGGKAGMDEIPGVQEGHFTSLNTNQFKFYSFFSRVGDAIRYRWVSRVRNFAAGASASKIFQLANTPQATLLDIFLDKEGMVVKIDVLRSSGDPTLDDAAVQAFYQASPLNHPPDGMIDPQTRMVNLKFSFFVRWNPVYTARGK